jgi:tetratricopeptide (TPR) repeat protein
MSVVARRYYVRGTDALGRGDLDAACEGLRAAIDLVPTFAPARVAYARALAKQGDTPRAAQALRAGLARPSTRLAGAAMWAALGDVLTLAGDFAAAEDAFRQAEQTDGFAVRAASGLARVYAKLGRYPEAFEQLARAASLSKQAG